ncbi:MAG: nicotinate phosphoribosyltransferase [Mycoplasmatales bacterium]
MNELIGTHTDLYQINMSYVYYKDNIHEKEAVFEVFYRKNPFNGGHGVFSGTQRIIEVINNFKFTDLELSYLKKNFNYDDDFLDYLKKMSFTGTLFMPNEGEIVFANEPIVSVQAPLIQAQLLETIILNIINYQTLISTKASKIRSVCEGKLFEFGSRRAHETNAALWGTRSAYIGGFDATSLVKAGIEFDIPVVGTHAHSFIQVYGDEYTAFKKYASMHKDCSFLVDTYDVLKSGMKNAIRVSKEMKDEMKFNAIRIDSGDLAYLSKKARKMLDDAGFKDTKIIVSNDLDEKIISSLLHQEAPIDYWGIGTNIITASDNPALGCVYKLVSIEKNDEMTDVIKISNSIEKITTPGIKQVYRIYNKFTNKAIGDYLAVFDLKFDNEIIMYDEKWPLKFKKRKDIYVKEILKKVFENGKLIYDVPTIISIKSYHNLALTNFWDEHLRYTNPEYYPVTCSKEIYFNKINLINKHLGDLWTR